MNVLNSTLMQRVGCSPGQYMFGVGSTSADDENHRVTSRRDIFNSQIAQFRALSGKVEDERDTMEEAAAEVYEASFYAQMLQEHSSVKKIAQSASTYSLPLSEGGQGGSKATSSSAIPVKSSHSGLQVSGGGTYSIAEGNEEDEVEGDNLSSITPLQSEAAAMPRVLFPKRRHHASTVNKGGFTSTSRRKPTQDLSSSTPVSVSDMSSNLWQDTGRRTSGGGRRSFSTHHVAGAPPPSISPTPSSSGMSFVPQKSALLKTGRRTVTHQNKLIVINEAGQKKSVNSVSSAFLSLYADDEDEEKGGEGGGSRDEGFSFVEDWKAQGWLGLMSKWSKCFSRDINDRVEGGESDQLGCWDRWTVWWKGCGGNTYPSEAKKERTGNSAARVDEIESLKYLQSKSREKLGINDSFWDASATHYILPVFASGRAYVPSTFESLLVQSFFGGLAPMICELFVMGQNNQAVLQVDIPKCFVDKKFSDLCFFFLSHRIICLGLYRAPQKRLGSMFPYLYLSPPGCAELYESDKAFVFGAYSRLTSALESVKEA
eukprot:CAMPEP_0114413554 /NCGR_PEP_ID=MMETSP0103-20121206/918_1 /TAXON_ID=37642 ORGANISM="Paraphysomonas imperforata, Strain PA2" /NCGR_SAMPLE_ID=MMETSP0103 /ASSEMBLY_ACC=CAM_ASM_000201 /LENGTH=542 /DNA_ID=CAMNT_0001581639 /DNA_START=26 /DNA_END=1654 /DNA_ORIENTATION=-